MEGLISAYDGENDPEISMKGWQIAGVGLEMHEAFEFILHAHFQGSILMGNDLKYWQSASAFAFNLMMDMKFIPSVSEEGAELGRICIFAIGRFIGIHVTELFPEPKPHPY